MTKTRRMQSFVLYHLIIMLIFPDSYHDREEVRIMITFPALNLILRIESMLTMKSVQDYPQYTQTKGGSRTTCILSLVPEPSTTLVCEPSLNSSRFSLTVWQRRWLRCLCPRIFPRQIFWCSSIPLSFNVFIFLVIQYRNWFYGST